MVLTIQISPAHTSPVTESLVPLFSVTKAAVIVSAYLAYRPDLGLHSVVTLPHLECVFNSRPFYFVASGATSRLFTTCGLTSKYQAPAAVGKVVGGDSESYHLV
jgi:hypothetical protein